MDSALSLRLASAAGPAVPVTLMIPGVALLVPSRRRPGEYILRDYDFHSCLRVRLALCIFFCRGPLNLHMFCILCIFFAYLAYLVSIIFFAFFFEFLAYFWHIVHIFCIFLGVLWHNNYAYWFEYWDFFAYFLHIFCIFFCIFLRITLFCIFVFAGLQAKPVWCSDWRPYITLWEFSVFAIKSSSKGLYQLFSNHETVSLPLLNPSHFHCLPCWITFIAWAGSSGSSQLHSTECEYP